MIGYCVPINPKLASFRLRVALPSRFVGPHVIGSIGDVTFFFKNGNPDLARKLKGPVVYDVVNAHFEDPDYRAMCEIATTVTCSSAVMAEIVRDKTGRESVVIPDPYENAEQKPEVQGDCIAWIGHPANYGSIEPYRDLPLYSVGGDWTRQKEDELLAGSALVLLTGSNPGASANRVVKALRAGRFVVAPEDSPESWKELSEYIWIGDVREGIAWTLNHREEACQKVASAQKHLQRFSPQSIGSRWAALFASTLAADTNTKKVGSASISR